MEQHTFTNGELDKLRAAAQKKGSMLTDEEREIALLGLEEFERYQRAKKEWKDNFRKALTALHEANR